MVSPKDTAYCYVYRSDWQNVEFPDHDNCKIPDVDLDPEAKGVWNVVAGVVGQIEEVKYKINVTSKGE